MRGKKKGGKEEWGGEGRKEGPWGGERIEGKKGGIEEGERRN